MKFIHISADCLLSSVCFDKECLRRLDFCGHRQEFGNMLNQNCQNKLTQQTPSHISCSGNSYNSFIKKKKKKKAFKKCFRYMVQLSNKDTLCRLEGLMVPSEGQPMIRRTEWKLSKSQVSRWNARGKKNNRQPKPITKNMLHYNKHSLLSFTLVLVILTHLLCTLRDGKCALAPIHLRDCIILELTFGFWSYQVALHITELWGNMQSWVKGMYESVCCNQVMHW